jgi:hypothetical protein
MTLLSTPQRIRQRTPRRLCEECGHPLPGLLERALDRLVYAQLHTCHVEYADRWTYYPEECGCTSRCHP